ncbi:MAG: acyl-CoA dehydrogenase [Sinobacteraceae bacterium]|nr:acyl-CoA dehydrogenase [Nevskiaceae bacterium]
MNFELSADQQLMQETFARFLNEESSMARVRAALPTGFDSVMWRGLAQLGAFSIRLPETSNGLGLLEATVLMEEVGRTLASGPVAETILAARLLATLGGPDHQRLLNQLLEGEAVVSIAFHDLEQQPVQWVAGGAVAALVIARHGAEVVLIDIPAHARGGEANLASTPIAELPLREGSRTLLAAGTEAVRTFARAIEEWKLLVGAALSGLSREALRLAASYATERKAFGQAIGTYQGVSHPLADLACDIDGGKYLLWKTLRDIAAQDARAGAHVSLSAWWNADTASRTVAQALHTFGGYGLTTDYDIHLYNLRAKAWPLAFGDPTRLLEEAGRRLYAGATTDLPEVGAVPVDFDLGEDAHALANELNAFFNATLTPELRAKAHYSFEGHDPEVHRKLAQARLLFPAWPREYGGREASPYSLMAAEHVWEEQGWSGHAAATTGMVGSIIQRFGSEELKKDVLARIAAGEAICSLGYSEPGAGSDVFAARTRALRDGDVWRIDGQKMFTSGANIADYVLLLTRTDPDAPKHKGLTMFIVPLRSPGVAIKPIYTFQDERTNITFYDGVSVPDTYRLGEVNAGARVLAAGLELEHGGGFAKTQQLMLRAAEDLCKQLYHNGRPLIADPCAQTRLALAKAHVEIAFLLTYRAFWAAVHSKSNLGFGPMAKLFSTEAFVRDSSDLLDLTAPQSLTKRRGPAGFLNQCYRHAQGTTIYGGTSEVHRSLIAERILGLPRTRSDGRPGAGQG